MEYLENNYDRNIRESGNIKDLKTLQLEERLKVLEKRVAELELQLHNQPRVKCPKCGDSNCKNNNFCIKCGEKLKENPIILSYK